MRVQDLEQASESYKALAATHSGGPSAASPRSCNPWGNHPVLALPTLPAGTGAQPGAARVLDLPPWQQAGLVPTPAPSHFSLSHSQQQAAVPFTYPAPPPPPPAFFTLCGFESRTCSQMACLNPGHSSCFISLCLTFPSVKWRCLFRHVSNGHCYSIPPPPLEKRDCFLLQGLILSPALLLHSVLQKQIGR